MTSLEFLITELLRPLKEYVEKNKPYADYQSEKEKIAAAAAAAVSSEAKPVELNATQAASETATTATTDVLTFLYVKGHEALRAVGLPARDIELTARKVAITKKLIAAAEVIQGNAGFLAGLNDRAALVEYLTSLKNVFLDAIKESEAAREIKKPEADTLTASVSQAPANSSQATQAAEQPAVATDDTQVESKPTVKDRGELDVCLENRVQMLDFMMQDLSADALNIAIKYDGFNYEENLSRHPARRVTPPALPIVKDLVASILRISITLQLSNIEYNAQAITWLPVRLPLPTFMQAESDPNIDGVVEGTFNKICEFENNSQKFTDRIVRLRQAQTIIESALFKLNEAKNELASSGYISSGYSKEHPLMVAMDAYNKALSDALEKVIAKLEDADKPLEAGHHPSPFVA